MLMHQLTLALHCASTVLQHKSLVHHPLEVLKVSSLQSKGQSITQAIQETFLLLLISVDLMQGIAGQLGELSDILFLLQLDHSSGNMMCMESSPKFGSVDALGLLMGLHISIPPVDCRTRELVRGYQHLLTVVALHHLQLLLNELEPIVAAIQKVIDV
jgi:hypothetical protein